MSDTSKNITSRLRHLFTPFSTRFIVGITVVVLSFLYFFLDLYYSYRYGQEGRTDLKLALIGLDTLVLSWFFGSSKSESDKAKTEQVRSLETETAQPPFNEG